MTNKYDLIMVGGKYEPYWLKVLLEDAASLGLVKLNYIDNSIRIGNIMFENIVFPCMNSSLDHTMLSLEKLKFFSIRALNKDMSVIIYHQIFGWRYPFSVKGVKDIHNFIWELHGILTSKKTEKEDTKFNDLCSDRGLEILNSFELGFEVKKCSENQYTDNVDNLATDQWGGAGPDCCTELAGGQHEKV